MRGAKFVRDEIAKGGDMQFNAPTGTGKTITVLSAIKGRRVCFISRVALMREQVKRMAETVGVAVDCLPPNVAKIADYDVLLVCETMRNIPFDHPCIIRF